jgi:hypothetical protein
MNKLNPLSVFLLLLAGPLILVSCEPKSAKEPLCNCCDVPQRTFPLDLAHTRLLSKFKESNDYDIISEVAVKIIKSEMPIATGMSVWRNNFTHNMYHPTRPDCPSMVFALSSIGYINYGELMFGYKHTQTALLNNAFHIPEKNMAISTPDTNTFFIWYYNRISLDSVPLQLTYNNKDSLVKGKYYDDFKYLGSVRYSVASNIGTLTNTYNNVFVAETRDTAAAYAKYIYIDLEYGLVRYVLNNGAVWSVVN